METVAPVSNEEVKPSLIQVSGAPAEAAKEPVAETPPKEESKPEISAKLFAEISKRERRIVEQQKRAKAELEKERGEFEKGRKEQERELAEFRELKALARSKPTDALSRLGTDYKTITDYVLNDGKATPESVRHEAVERIRELELRLEAQGKSWKEQEQQRIQEENARLEQSWNDNIVDTVKRNSEKYELINLFEQAPTVAQLIKLHYAKTEAEGSARLLTVEEAAELLETDLEKQWEKVLKSKKFSSRVSPPPEKKDEKKPLSQNQPKTITNDMTSSAPSMLPANTEADRIRRALEKLNGTVSA